MENQKSFNLTRNIKKYINKRNFLILLYAIVPLAVSVISTIHSIKLFSMGNEPYIATATSIIFEVAHIASFVGVIVLGYSKRMYRIANYTVFLILFIIQVIGNVYYSYDFVSTLDTKSLINVKEIVSYISSTPIEDFESSDIISVKFWYSVVISAFIPVISLILFSLLPVAISLPSNSKDDDVLEDPIEITPNAIPEIISEIVPIENTIVPEEVLADDEIRFDEMVETIEDIINRDDIETVLGIFYEGYEETESVKEETIEDIINRDDIETVLDIFYEGYEIPESVNIEKEIPSLSNAKFDGIVVNI